MQAGRGVHASCCHREGWTCAANAPGGDRHRGGDGGDGGDGDGCDGSDGGDGPGP